MEMDAMSLRGYCRTFRPPRPANCGKNIGSIALGPAIRITKLTTIARTGRLMKRSLNDFIYKLGIRNPNWGRDALVALRLEGEPAPSAFVIRASSFKITYLPVSDSVPVWAQDHYSL